MAEPYDPDLRARILAELYRRRTAGESFDALAATPGWPSRPTLRKWLRQSGAPPPPAIRQPPVRWSPGVAAEIIGRFHEQSLREICEDPAMPDRKTIDRWRRKHPGFAAVLEAVRIETRQPWTGRRSTFSALIADDVSELVFEAGTIGAACRLYADLPPRRTIDDWTRAHPDFARAIDIAMNMARERDAGPMLEAVRRWLEDPAANPKSAPLPRHLRHKP